MSNLHLSRVDTHTLDGIVSYGEMLRAAIRRAELQAGGQLVTDWLREDLDRLLIQAFLLMVERGCYHAQDDPAAPPDDEDGAA